MGQVNLEVKEGIATVTFTNEGRLNAMDGDVAKGLREVIAEAKTRTDIGAMVLRGGGNQSFCSGADLKFVQTYPDREDGFKYLDSQISHYRTDMADMPFPTVAMMNKICYGGGCYIAAATDFRFSDPSLKLAIPAVRTRRYYSVKAIERLGALMGPTNIKRILLGDEVFTAPRLHQWGFIDEIHPAEELEAATYAFAKKMAGQPKDVVRYYMECLRTIERGDMEKAAALNAKAWEREFAMQAEARAAKAKG